MNEIRDFFLNVFNTRHNINSVASKAIKSGPMYASTASQAEEEISQRIARDTITLSEGGQKFVNLERGNELSEEFRNSPVENDVAKILSSALDDIFRVIRLFTETIKTAFSNNREKS